MPFSPDVFAFKNPRQHVRWFYHHICCSGEDRRIGAWLPLVSGSSGKHPEDCVRMSVGVVLTRHRTVCVCWFFVIYFLFLSFPFDLHLFCSIGWVLGLECRKSRQFWRATGSTCFVCVRNHLPPIWRYCSLREELAWPQLCRMCY